MTKDPSFLHQSGESYRDFVVTKHLPIDELKCVLREIVHTPSGAMVMHIENDDPENLFCLSFKTLPYSSNGVAHILEHRCFAVPNGFLLKTRFLP
jgi:hypothetical protein